MESGRDEGGQFEVIVRETDGTFFLYSREWRLLVQGSDLKQTYEKIKDERREILERYRKAGLEHELPSFRAKASMLSVALGFGLDIFASLAKALIVGVMLCAFVFLIGFNQIHLLAKKVEDMTSPSPSLLGKIGAGMIEKVARGMEELTPERREVVRRSLQTIERELESYKNEARPLASEFPIRTIKPHP